MGALPDYFWGGMTFLDHLLELYQIPGFEATVAFGSQTIRETDRKLAASKLWLAVLDQFIPVIQ